LCKKPVKIGLFLAILEPRDFTEFLSLNVKKEGESLDFIKTFALFIYLYILWISTKIHFTQQTRNQFESNLTRVRIPPSPPFCDKSELMPIGDGFGFVHFVKW